MLKPFEKIIISLDDFGISTLANSNMLKLISSKKIDRISVMPHGIISQVEIHQLIKSNIRLDIHVDINDKIAENRKLKDGFFKRTLGFMFDYIFGKYQPKKIELLWENQILAFQEKFHRKPDGIGSHQHVHFFPPFFRIIIRLSKKYDIPYVRLGKEPTKNFNLVSIALNLLQIFDKKYLLSTSIASSDLMWSADWIDGFNFEKQLKNISRDTQIEIIFHPERADEFAFLKKIVTQTNNFQ